MYTAATGVSRDESSSFSRRDGEVLRRVPGRENYLRVNIAIVYDLLEED